MELGLSRTQEAMCIHCPQQTIKVDAVVGVVSEVGCDQVQCALEDGLKDGWHLVDHKELTQTKRLREDVCACLIG